MRKPLFQPSMETIAFQTSAFGQMISAMITDMKETETRETIRESKFLDLLSKLVKKQTNMNIKFSTYTDKEDKSDYGPASVIIAKLSVNHIFNRYSFINLFIKQGSIVEALSLIEKNKAKETFIDTKNITVGGVFEEAESTIYISPNYLYNSSLTADEFAAIVLHEIGHVFYNFEYMDRVMTTNQVLATLLTEEYKAMEPGKRKVVLKKASTVLENNRIPLDELADSKTDGSAAVAIITSTVDGFYSETGSHFYDYSSCEQLADNFAARHGFARSLASGLHKIVSPYERDLRRLATINEIMAVVSAITVSAIAVVCVTIAATPLIALVYGILGFIWLRGMTLGNLNDTPGYGDAQWVRYDDLRVRLKRIREQIVIFIKTAKVNSKALTDALNDLDVIDKLISDTPEPTDGVVKKLYEFFNPRSKSNRQVKEIQRTLEELSTNVMFIYAAKLSQIKAA